MKREHLSLKDVTRILTTIDPALIYFIESGIPFTEGGKYFVPASMATVQIAVVGTGGVPVELGGLGELPTDDQALHRELEGFYGVASDKNPTDIVCNVHTFVTDASGNYGPVTVVGTPGAGYRTRVLAAIIGIDSATCVNAGSCLLSDETPNVNVVVSAGVVSRNMGHVPAVNALLTADEALEVSVTGSTAATVHYVIVTTRTEDA